jgi:hypothetical protein
MQNVSAATRRPGQAGQSPPVTPSLPSLTSTPTRVQPPAVGAPAAADPATGSDSATRVRETDEQPRWEPRQRPPPPEPVQQPDWFEEIAAKIEEAAQAEVASEAASVGARDRSSGMAAVLKMLGAMVVMDHEADARRCADSVGSMPPVQCKDTRRVYHPRKVYPASPAAPAEPAAPTAAVPAAPAASSGAAAPITPIPPADAPPLSGRLHLEARERRASEGGVEPRHSGNSAAPSGSGGVATLADLPPSEEQEDHCAICGGIGVQGRNELVRCGFGDSCCILEPGEAPRRACWHAACEPKLRGKQGQHVVCARHEKDARLQLDVGASPRQA